MTTCGKYLIPWLVAAALGVSAAVPGPVAGVATTGQPSQTGPRFDISQWKTNFSKHSVPLSEIVPDGPPRDQIPAIDKPVFVTPYEADRWLTPMEPVLLFGRGSDVRAYPLQILIWHEIVNDTVGGVPAVITFCPLCHTGIAFVRRVGSRTVTFGTTGYLRFSNLVMYDRQTESWWQQATGDAIVGDLTGTQLTPMPAQIVSWAMFKLAFPNGRVLSRHTGFERPYGQNPYSGYDDIRASPFFFRGSEDPRLPPMERVVAVSLVGDDVAYPFSVLERVRVVNDSVGGQAIVVVFAPGVASALSQSVIASGRDVGTSGVFARKISGRTLTFVDRDGRFVDTQTGSTWSIVGAATAGPLRGLRLTPIFNRQQFWFSAAVLSPHTRIFRP